MWQVSQTNLMSSNFCQRLKQVLTLTTDDSAYSFLYLSSTQYYFTSSMVLIPDTGYRIPAGGQLLLGLRVVGCLPKATAVRDTSEL